VVFFREQELSPAEFMAFAKRIGKPIEYPFVRGIDGFPEIIEVKKLEHEKINFGGIWHSDTAYLEVPPMASMLLAREVPPRGGDTLFANMYAAYEALSDRMKAYLDGLTALHDGEQTYRGLYANYGVADRVEYPRAEHPVVRTHPVTGRKALYVNRGFTRFIVGIPRDESDAMLAYLYQHAENPLFQCRFRWTENAIAFWDNRCAQHRAMWDYWPHTRSGTRVTVKGERPV
jgi:taurine dioxygenase